MEITGKNLIGYSESALGSKTFQSLSPAKGEHLTGDFYAATDQEVAQTLKLAEQAFKSYSRISAEKRADFLDRITDEILALGDVLVQRACAESALPQGRIEGERGRTIGQLKSFAQLLRDGFWLEATIDQANPDRPVAPKPDTRRLLVPVGPVLVFGASNFPLAFSTAGGDTASALAAGNPVIVKSHNGHSGTGELVSRAILKAAKDLGMPEGVFSFLHDEGIKVAGTLVKAPQIKSVAFTGSFKGGKAIYDLANTRPDPIPVFAEMGSINPVILFPSALEKHGEAYADLYAGSITLGTGQFCTNPGLMIALKSEHLENYIKLLGNRIKEIAPCSMLTQPVYQGFRDNLKTLLEQKEVIKVSESTGSAEAKQLEGTPTLARVSAQAFIKNSQLQEEVFGPLSLIVQCEDLEEMQAVCAQLQGQLTVTIMGDEEDVLNHNGLIQELSEKTGRIIFNNVPTGVEVCASMQHGGPYPASTDARFTSVGTSAIKRFARPLTFQNWPDAALPGELRNGNPLNIWRLLDNQWTKEPIS